ncbi:uncharacterized protein N7506_012257 [Penicillium brevicompactum]|uniref:uncharacterized protein n=1 Tax=Penicillium brevicompactum TaxID=5074 RepID=UPI0025409B98|nr:uncharacterized protein N7506_012257 [Penicillium brevicompactum]KAJ5319553.1 hypothetical protein N7506_012257 [Penicillium brevicompactum]
MFITLEATWSIKYPSTDMKFTFTSIAYILCLFTAMVEALTRYETTPPSDATVLIDRQALNDMAKDHPYGALFPENGG